MMLQRLTQLTLTLTLVATLWLMPPSALAQSLDNNPSIDQPTVQQTGQVTQTQAPEPINPMWFIVPIAIVAIIALWLMRPSDRQAMQRHSQPTYSAVGFKGGEASRYRTDNDVYADSLNDQEARLRRIFDDYDEPDDELSSSTNRPPTP